MLPDVLDELFVLVVDANHTAYCKNRSTAFQDGSQESNLGTADVLMNRCHARNWISLTLFKADKQSQTGPFWRGVLQVRSAG